MKKKNCSKILVRNIHRFQFFLYLALLQTEKNWHTNLQIYVVDPWCLFFIFVYNPNL